MKKGITPEAAQRLAAFLQKRAQQYNPEEGSLSDAVEDLLWDVNKKMDRTLEAPLYEMIDILERSVDESLPAVEEGFSASFDSLVAEMRDTVATSLPEAPLPDPQVLEALKQEQLGNLRAFFSESFREFLSQAAGSGVDSYEVKRIFKDAAAGASGGTVP